MSVQEYLDKHLLARKIEDAVNAAVRAKTLDPVLFIVISFFPFFFFCFISSMIQPKSFCCLFPKLILSDFDFSIQFDVHWFQNEMAVESFEEIGQVSDHEGESEADP